MNTRRYAPLGLIAAISGLLGLAACFAPEEEYEEGEAAVTGETEVTIRSVKLNPQYTEKCPAGSCKPGDIKGQEASDLAVMIVDGDLSAYPTVPIDLDSLNAPEGTFTVESFCETLESTGTTLKTAGVKTMPPASLQADSIQFSPDAGIADVDATLAALGKLYIVSPGSKAPNAGGNICKADFGGPNFRTKWLAVTGITSGMAFRVAEPNRASHILQARVDEASGAGPWLRGLGVTVTKTMSPVAAMARSAEDGGSSVPDADGGDAGRAPAPAGDGGRAPAPAPADGPGEMVQAQALTTSTQAKILDSTFRIGTECTGVKVGANHILTAASCLTKASVQGQFAEGAKLKLTVATQAAPPPPPPGSVTPPPGSATPPPGSATPPPGSATPPPGSATPPPGSATPPPGSATPPPGSATPPPPPPPMTDAGENTPPPTTGEPLPTESEEEMPNEPSDMPDYESSSSGPSATDSLDGGKKPTKKKKTASSGCSAAPGTTTGTTDGLTIGLGLGLAAIVARRRKKG